VKPLSEIRHVSSTIKPLIGHCDTSPCCSCYLTDKQVSSRPPHWIAAAVHLQLLSMASRQRQLRREGSHSFAHGVLAMALAPALYVGRMAGVALQLPVRIAVFWLQLADALICDLLAILTKQPGHKAQVCARAAGSGCTAAAISSAHVCSSSCVPHIELPSSKDAASVTAGSLQPVTALATARCCCC
jgi:hypothetical protein